MSDFPTLITEGRSLGLTHTVLLPAVISAFLRGDVFTPSRPPRGGMGHNMNEAGDCGLVTWMKDAHVGEVPSATVRPAWPWPWVFGAGAGDRYAL